MNIVTNAVIGFAINTIWSFKNDNTNNRLKGLIMKKLQDALKANIREVRLSHAILAGGFKKVQIILVSGFKGVKKKYLYYNFNQKNINTIREIYPNVTECNSIEMSLRVLQNA